MHHGSPPPLSWLATAIVAATLLLAPQAAGYPWTVCGETNFKANSKYLDHLNTVADMLPTTASMSPQLFATAVVGAAPEQLWSIGLCRGDINASECFGCLSQGFQDLPNDCSYNKDATIFYDTCTLHYSGVNFRPDDNTDTTMQSFFLSNNANITTDSARFHDLRAALMNATADYAAYNSSWRFATGEANFNDEFPKLYSLAQCTPDQTPAQCRKCLASLIKSNLDVFGDRIGGRVLWVNCIYRYGIAPFFKGEAMVRMASASSGASAQAPIVQPAVQQLPSGGGSDHRKAKLVIPVALSIAVFCVILVGCITLLIKRIKRGARKQEQRRARFQNISKTQEALKLWKIEESGSEFTLYDFSELAASTDGFSAGSRLGRGGFGPVYKGKLVGGLEIAVKRLAAQSVQGLEEFKNEIQIIAKVQHTNLVRLIGCCVQEEEKILVYEYMPNGSLDFFIFDQVRRPLLDWKKRLHIIEGIVQGLLYLHKHSRVRIIHRDLKASNILLDKDLNPKISDFGMARIFGSNITEANTNRVVGTYGYMAPEYASEGIFSVRSDVFSLGVLLLEIISGKRINGHQDHYDGFINLLGYAWNLWSKGRVFELIDPTLPDCVDVATIVRCIKVALLCVQDKAMDRPTMTEVTAMLGCNSAALRDPSHPPYFHLRVSDDDGSSSKDEWQPQTRPQLTGLFSINDVTITMVEEGR